MTEPSLHPRRRRPTEEELLGVPWLAHMSATDRERAVYELRITDAAPGDVICRMGRPATYWFGVVDGLLKMSTETARGQTIT